MPSSYKHVKQEKTKVSGKEQNRTKSSRHDFTKDTVRQLRDMAGNVCSYPGCHRHTTGPKEEGNRPFTIGVAAHIRAASPQEGLKKTSRIW